MLGMASVRIQSRKYLKKKNTLEYLKKLNQDIGHTGNGMAKMPHRHCSSEINRNRKGYCC